MKPEYLALSLICAFLIAVILTWRKFRAIDGRFARMQQEINELRWMESRLFLMEVYAKNTADRTDAASQKGAAANETAVGVQPVTPLSSARRSE
jgi:hypothetical protein